MRETASLVSLGCPKNLIDSEVILGLLSKEGYLLTTDPSRAEVLIVNSCSFIEEATKEAIETALINLDVGQRVQEGIIARGGGADAAFARATQLREQSQELALERDRIARISMAYDRLDADVGGTVRRLWPGLVGLDARLPALRSRYRELQRERRARDFILREGVRETLNALRDRGLHLGIVSNIDDDQLEHMLELSQVEPHFDSVLSSEQAQSCKPDSGIFSEALRRAGCDPHEAMFVGDSLQQDIAGANRLGLRSVLIWSDAERQPTIGEYQPKHVIRRIPELVGLL